jgi:hypothetical protein
LAVAVVALTGRSCGAGDAGDAALAGCEDCACAARSDEECGLRRQAAAPKIRQRIPVMMRNAERRKRSSLTGFLFCDRLCKLCFLKILTF